MPELRVLSLGWGVQSFTLAAMSALGELPKLDVLIHADTSWERQATYEFAAKWQPWLESKGMLVLTATSLSTRYIERPGNNQNFIPSYFEGRKGIVNVSRQCTSRWKIAVVRQLIRQELAIRGVIPAPGVVELWLGISWDEASRASNANGVGYIQERWPFLEKDTRMRRSDCINWLKSNGFDLPVKSSCTQCPYHNQKTWEEQKRESPEDWAQSVRYDQLLTATPTSIKGERIKLFVHRTTRPLAESVFLPEEAGYSQSFLPMDGPGCDTAGYCWD
jgi:hypothetical protein